MLRFLRVASLRRAFRIRDARSPRAVLAGGNTWFSVAAECTVQIQDRIATGRLPHLRVKNRWLFGIPKKRLS